MTETDPKPDPPIVTPVSGPPYTAFTFGDPVNSGAAITAPVSGAAAGGGGSYTFAG